MKKKLISRSASHLSPGDACHLEPRTGGKKIISLLVIMTAIIFITEPYLTIAEDVATASPDSVLATTTPPVLPVVSPPSEQATSTASSSPAVVPDPVLATTTNPTLTDTSTPDSAVTPSSAPASLLDPASATTTPPALTDTSTPDSAVTPSSTPTTFGTKFSEAAGTPEASLAAPVVKAVWEMQGSSGALLGSDNSPDAGAQFLPSGQYRVSKPFSVCAVVSDASGADDIDSIASDIYYPEEDFGRGITDGRNGCGKEEGKYQMSRLPKDQGLALFCDNIQQKNANLPGFYDLADFAGICGQEGELQKETASVFCADGKLLYDDLSGEYKVSVSAKDKAGANSNILNNGFSYLELTAFETDFASLNYGRTGLNALQTIEGDAVWRDIKGENHSTVRNVGNTRMQMAITQDDMGLGKTDGVWNIRYGNRVGADSLWKNYWPGETVLFDNIFGLAEMEPIDFAITVLGFPRDDVLNYSGKMTLNAQKAEHLVCGAQQSGAP